MKQKDAVVNAITEVLGDKFVQKTTVVADVITKEEKQQVRDHVFNAIMAGDVTYKKDTSNTDAVRRYVNGMVDNHIRKAKELNGGKTYKPATTGTKRDEQLKNLNRLLKSGQYEEGTEEYNLIVDHIKQRTKEIEQKRSGKKTSTISQIDTSVLPQHLADMVGGSNESTT